MPQDACGYLFHSKQFDALPRTRDISRVKQVNTESKGRYIQLREKWCTYEFPKTCLTEERDEGGRRLMLQGTKGPQGRREREKV